jgi:hypothetical protein
MFELSDDVAHFLFNDSIIIIIIIKPGEDTREEDEDVED